MIDIHDSDVNWNEELANDPRLILYVDGLPSRSELAFDGSEDLGLWYGEHEDGYVDFYAWSGGQGEGYSGRHFEIETVDGRKVTLQGPFSSRAGVMNKVGFGPCLDVTYRTDLDQKRGGRAGAVTLEAAEEAVDRYLDEVELVREVKFDDEPYWIPRRTDSDASTDIPR